MTRLDPAGVVRAVPSARRTRPGADARIPATPDEVLGVRRWFRTGSQGRSGRQWGRRRTTHWSVRSSSSSPSIVTIRPRPECGSRPVGTTICTGTAPPVRRSSVSWRPRSNSSPSACSATISEGSAGAFAYGVEWCIENGVDIINVSMSTASDRWAEPFWELVDEATFRGVLLVSAMNNERKRTIPSELAGVFSVACGPGTDREADLVQPGRTGRMGCGGHRRRRRLDGWRDDPHDRATRSLRRW